MLPIDDLGETLRRIDSLAGPCTVMPAGGSPKTAGGLLSPARAAGHDLHDDWFTDIVRTALSRDLNVLGRYVGVAANRKAAIDTARPPSRSAAAPSGASPRTQPEARRPGQRRDRRW